jgi:hypothetical protein
MQAAVSRKINLAVKVMFWVMVAIFIVVVATVVSENVVDFISFEMGFFVLGGIAVILGIAIVILAARSSYDKLSRSFLILTGSSMAGILAGALLHNLIYGLVIEFGSGSRIIESVGGFTEAAFFIIGTLISPVAFLAGAVGTIVQIARKRI